jgi:hypothetical protein
MGMVGAMLPPMQMPERIATPEPQRHTGAGGAGMHAAWKKRRAAGRA